LAFNALKKLIATTRFHRFEVLAESYVIWCIGGNSAFDLVGFWLESLWN
jgi:hypothetical protein